jgi:hypothetical protein
MHQPAFRFWRGVGALSVALVPAGQVVSLGTGHASLNANWGPAREIRGLTALPPKEYGARLTAISCAAPGDCVAGGDYATSGDPRYPGEQAFLVEEVNGSWGHAFELPGYTKLNVAGWGGPIVKGISCFSPGNCAVVGDYENNSSIEGFVASEIRGKWGHAEEIPGLAALTAGGSGGAKAVSCPAVGACVAVGAYRTAGGSSGVTYAYVVTQSEGTWGQVHTVAGVTGAVLTSISCPALGACLAGGGDVENQQQSAFVVQQTKGTWGPARDVRGQSLLGQGGLGQVSCWSASNCIVAGGFTGSGGANDREDFVAAEIRGNWLNARPIPGLRSLNLGEDALVSSLSCGTDGRCVLGGTYLRSAGGKHFAAFVEVSVDGNFQGAHRISGLDAIDPLHGSGVTSVSCTSSGDCGVVGYDQGSGTGAGFVATESGGSWKDAKTIKGSGFLPNGWEAVSCVSLRCIAVGAGFEAQATGV